jgi:hypothetical protein
MDSIWTVTVLVRDEGIRQREGGKAIPRCWGWYASFADAECAVLENHTDIFECLYSHAVIERFEPGVMAMSHDPVWYEALAEDGKPYPATVRRCECPDEFAQTCNWGMG